MTIRDILTYPDPRLLQAAQKVQVVDADIKTLVEDMFETMYADDGIGLAAPQIGVCAQVLVMDLSPDRSAQICLINPEIIARKGSTTCEEGCLSLPGVRFPITRAEWVQIRALDEHGKLIEGEADGWLARCIQHEMDHLEGKVMFDHLSAAEQARAKQVYLEMNP